MRTTKADVEHRLARAEREIAAFRELFHCENMKLPREAVPVSQTVTATLHGATRAAGGVVVVETDVGRHYPRFLDDVIAEWSKGSATEREAAAGLQAARERAWKQAI